MSGVHLGIDDFDDDLINDVFERARSLRERPPARLGNGPVVGLAFFEASLRTRAGFTTAAVRLGGGVVDVVSPRMSATSNSEPWTETLRVLSGMVDLVVARPGLPLDRATTERWSICPVVNGGDTGDDAEHPTQALLDLFAIEELVGPIDQLTVAVCGDLRTRVSRSFLKLLRRRPPARLVIISEPALLPAGGLPVGLDDIAEYRSLPDLRGVDVVSAVGLPHGAVKAAARTGYTVTGQAMDTMPDGGVVLSPMPVLDEVETAALGHERVRIYEQSDLGVPLRMALLSTLFA